MDGVDGGVMTTPNKKREQAVMGGDKKRVRWSHVCVGFIGHTYLYKRLL